MCVSGLGAEGKKKIRYTEKLVVEGSERKQEWKSVLLSKVTLLTRECIQKEEKVQEFDLE